MLYLLMIVAVMVLDRIVKIAVSTNMAPGESIPVIQNIFHITYVQNTGAAFSMLQGHPLLLIIVPGIVILIGIIFVLVMAKEYNRVFLCSLSLICGGGLGNLTDRISQGYVTDMFDFRVFPVFNVADICVCVGCGLLMLYMIIYSNTSEEKRKKSGNAGSADQTGGAKASGKSKGSSSGKASGNSKNSGSSGKSKNSGSGKSSGKSKNSGNSKNSGGSGSSGKSGGSRSVKRLGSSKGGKH